MVSASKQVQLFGKNREHIPQTTAFFTPLQGARKKTHPSQLGPNPGKVGLRVSWRLEGPDLKLWITTIMRQTYENDLVHVWSSWSSAIHRHKGCLILKKDPKYNTLMRGSHSKCVRYLSTKQLVKNIVLKKPANTYTRVFFLVSPNMWC